MGGGYMWTEFVFAGGYCNPWASGLDKEKPE